MNEIKKSNVYLRPKQHMDIELLVHKGIGRDHAKFSPVCTAFYRLLPTITLLKDFTGDVSFILH